MTSTVLLTVSIILFYLVITIGINWWTTKNQKVTTIADIFTGSRSLGILALSMAIFGSQITAFGILGGPGVAYRFGYSTLGYILGACIAPVMGFYIFGNRAWLLSNKYNYVTPAQFFGDRFGNNAPRFVVGFAQIFFMVPYVLICGIGAGAILSTLTGGFIPYWLGSLIVLLICSWTAFSGGMKGTAYTNIFQGILIFVVLILMMYYVYKALGGGSAITIQLPNNMLSMGGEGIQKPGMWIPYSLLATGLSNGIFGHLLIRNMSANHPKTIQMNAKIYPILAGIFWAMAVVLGVWGSIAIPGLEGSSTENIVPLLAQQLAPVWMIGVLGAGILAAIMSSWDGMILTMSSIFSEDFYKPIFIKGRNKKSTEDQEKNISRIFIIIISIVIYILVIWRPASILSIATFSFAGMATLTPAYFACFYWKRASKWAVILSAITGPLSCALWAFNILPTSTTFGMFYGAPSIILSIVVLIVVTYMTKPAPQENIDMIFSAFEEVYED